MAIMRIQGSEKRSDSRDAAGAREASHIATVTSARLYVVQAYNNNVATRWLHVFDLTAVPSNGAIPTLPPVEIASGQVGTHDYSDGIPFSTGIVAVLSTTAATLTATGTTDGIFLVTYRSTAI